MLVNHFVFHPVVGYRLSTFADVSLSVSVQKLDTTWRTFGC